MKKNQLQPLRIAGILVWSSSAALAQTWVGNTSQDWAEPTNWDGGAAPASNANVFINNVTASSPNAPVLTTAYLLDPNGAGGDMFIGNGGANGTLDINAGGSLDGSGNWLLVGEGAGGVGSLNVNAGGEFVGDNQIRLGRAGATGNLNVNGGSVGGAGFDEGGGVAQINVTNNGIINVTGNIRMNGNGSSSIDSGSITSGGQLLIGAAGAAGTHTLDITGGDVTANSWVVVGHVSGNTIVNLSDGTLTQNAANRFFTIGANGGANGTINQTGGTVTDNGNDGGTFLGEGAGSTGTYNLSGGDFFTNRIRVGAGTGNLNLNGGTLHALQNDAAFIGATVNVDIQAGGGNIDTGGFNVTMNTPLSGVGDLSKMGLGNLNVIGDGDGGTTFTGAINVTAGGIGLGGDFTDQSLSIPASGGIEVTDEDPGLDALGSLSLNSLALGAGASINLNIAETDLSDRITVVSSGGLSFSTAVVNIVPDDIVFFGSKAVIEGVYTIFEYTTSFTGDINNLSVGNGEIGYVYNFNDTGSAITLEVILNDSDGDGLPDDYELANFGNLAQDYDDNFDNDFATNGEEFVAGTNPSDGDDDPLDLDNDEILDADEVLYFGNIAYSDGTGDADGDCETDLAEINNFQVPTDATSFTDSDDDGLPDAYELNFFGSLTQDGSGDFDSDNFTDLEEYAYGSNPADSAWSPAFAKAAHRWSFNGNLTDSIGSSDAVIQPGDTSSTNTATVGANSVTMTGGAKAASQWVQLGSGLLPEKNTAVTVELWATNNAIQNWSRVFSFHDLVPEETMFISWTRGTGANTDQNAWYNDDNDPDSNGDNSAVGDIHAFAVGVEYHIVMTICPVPDDINSSQVTFYSADSTALDLGPAKGSFISPVRVSSMLDVVNALGRSRYADNTASASYNEVRIFDGCLQPWALDALHAQGPDAASLIPADSDADGLPDAFENYYFFGLTETLNGDPDGDFSTNKEELLAGTDPDDAASNPADVDADGLPDAWEIANFGDITLQDSFGDPDGDFEDNLTEFIASTDPNNYFSFTDTDNDNMSDGWEDFFVGNLDDDGTSDEDGDTFDTLAEFNAASDPLNPLQPGVKDGDADGDGLPDRWEVNTLLATSLADFSGTDNSDGDSDNNLAEYQATSDPLDDASTASDVNGDGITDIIDFQDMETLGSGLLDGDGEALFFTTRLAGSGANYAASDLNLNLDTTFGTLAITSNDPFIVGGGTDINGQLNMADLQAIGIPLSSQGFTGNEDFRIRAHFTCLPFSDGYDQIGVYAGTSTTAMTRAASLGGGNLALGVNTDGINDSNPFFGAAGTAGAADSDVTVVIERIGGIWNYSCNGNNCTPGAQPNFLDGNAALEAGVYYLVEANQKTVELESFTIVTFGGGVTELEVLSCGFDSSGNFVIEMASDATGATVSQSTDLVNFAAIAPGDLTVAGTTITIAAGAIDPDTDGDSFFQVSK